MPANDRIEFARGGIELNANRRKTRLTVRNSGDRAIQVGSHYHFFEANRALVFDRVAALGMHLDVPAGTAIRFEPGDTHDVVLCSYGGIGFITGFSGLVQGSVRSRDNRARAIRRMETLRFGDTAESDRDQYAGATAGGAAAGRRRATRRGGR